MSIQLNRSQRTALIVAVLTTALGCSMSTAYAGSHSKNSSKHGYEKSSKHGYSKSSERKVYGTATSVNAGAGTFAVAGVTIQTNGATRFEGYGKHNYISAAQFFNDIAGGAVSVKAKGYVDAANQFVATKVEYQNANNGYSRDDYYSGAYNIKLKGTASQVNAGAGTLAIQGMNIMTDAATYFQGEYDLPMSREQFFAAVQPGVSWIEVKAADQGNGQALAVKLELKGYYGY